MLYVCAVAPGAPATPLRTTDLGRAGPAAAAAAAANVQRPHAISQSRRAAALVPFCRRPPSPPRPGAVPGACVCGTWRCSCIRPLVVARVGRALVLGGKHVCALPEQHEQLAARAVRCATRAAGLQARRAGRNAAAARQSKARRTEQRALRRNPEWFSARQGARGARAGGVESTRSSSSSNLSTSAWR